MSSCNTGSGSKSMMVNAFGDCYKFWDCIFSEQDMLDAKKILWFVCERSPRSINDFQSYFNWFWLIVAYSSWPYIIKTIPQLYGERYPSPYNASSFYLYKYLTSGTIPQKKSNFLLGNQNYMTQDSLQTLRHYLERGWHLLRDLQYMRQTHMLKQRQIKL